MAYHVKQINETAYLLDGDGHESMYLIIGGTHALLIDTGMEPEPLLPVVRTLTDKPILVALTHGHFDHMGRTGEFEKVFIHPKDLALYQEHIHFTGLPAPMEKLDFKPADQLLPLPDTFDLGGLTIHTVPLQGHTPGSVVFADCAHKLVFTGDAIGSGCGVLMLIDGALGMGEYKKGLDGAALVLESLGVTEDWKFYGGHDHQEYLSRVAPYNRLDLRLLKDMSILCEKLLDGTAHMEEKDHPFRSRGKPYYAVYGKAEMDVSKECIY